MTTINGTAPLASYLASAAKITPATSGASQERPAEGSKDPVAELRALARQLLARGEGGLLRALDSGRGLHLGASQRAQELSSGIELPDVAAMDRDDAGKLLAQVEKLIDAGLGDSDGFVGFNDGQRTESLATYRDWLQARGGVSIYV
ncbi:hypothetical protein AAFN46_10130 [Pseudomonas sp. CAU 1711]|uniref:hypothetical protein n=1 Tax=Pseudomonas sp. CAU 1711 TaxID=3140356 RepID=UPI00326065B8